ncbi:MAG: sigma-70 family RNA polymerase sigma factor [Bacillota bacterium]
MPTVKYIAIDELAYLAKTDSCAFEILYLRLQNLVKAWIRPYHLPGASREDILQEASLGLLTAVKIYDPEFSKDFMALAKTCIMRHVFNVVKKEMRKKNMVFYNSLRLEEPLGESDDCTLADVVPSAENAYDDLIASIDIAEILNTVSFSKLEDAVFRLRLEKDLGIQEICSHLGCSYKRVDNALQRIKNKLACKARVKNVLIKTS